MGVREVGRGRVGSSKLRWILGSFAEGSFCSISSGVSEGKLFFECFN